MKSLYEIVQSKELEIAYREAVLRGDEETALKISSILFERLLKKEGII